MTYAKLDIQILNLSIYSDSVFCGQPIFQRAVAGLGKADYQSIIQDEVLHNRRYEPSDGGKGKLRRERLLKRNDINNVAQGKDSRNHTVHQNVYNTRREGQNAEDRREIGDLLVMGKFDATFFRWWLTNHSSSIRRSTRSSADGCTKIPASEGKYDLSGLSALGVVVCQQGGRQRRPGFPLKVETISIRYSGLRAGVMYGLPVFRPHMLVKIQGP